MTPQALERFLAKVDKTGNCWLWTGTPGGDYGRFSMGGRNTSVMAHRASYEHFVGPIPEGMHIDHLCEVKRCVNPEHLEPVLQWVNTVRSMGPSGVNLRKTQCPEGHPLDADNTYHWRGTRHCRACRYEAQRRFIGATTVGRGTFGKLKTHCPQGHEYTPENTYLQVQPTKTTRSCKACRKIAFRRYKASLRGAPQQPRHPKAPQP